MFCLFVCLYFTWLFRKLWWLDEGGGGTPAKLGQAQMDGSNPKILLRDLQSPSSLTYNRQKLYFTVKTDPAQVDVYDLNLSEQRTFLNEEENVWRPSSLRVFGDRLLFVDPRFEAVVAVGLKNRERTVLAKNEASLGALAVIEDRDSGK